MYKALIGRNVLVSSFMAYSSRLVRNKSQLMGYFGSSLIVISIVTGIFLILYCLTKSKEEVRDFFNGIGAIVFALKRMVPVAFVYSLVQYFEISSVMQFCGNQETSMGVYFVIGTLLCSWILYSFNYLNFLYFSTRVRYYILEFRSMFGTASDKAKSRGYAEKYRKHSPTHRSIEFAALYSSIPAIFQSLAIFCIPFFEFICAGSNSKVLQCLYLLRYPLVIFFGFMAVLSDKILNESIKVIGEDGVKGYCSFQNHSFSIDYVFKEVNMKQNSPISFEKIKNLIQKTKEDILLNSIYEFGIIDLLCCVMAFSANMFILQNCGNIPFLMLLCLNLCLCFTKCISTGVSGAYNFRKSIFRNEPF